QNAGRTGAKNVATPQRDTTARMACRNLYRCQHYAQKSLQPTLAFYAALRPVVDADAGRAAVSAEYARPGNDRWPHGEERPLAVVLFPLQFYRPARRFRSRRFHRQRIADW